MLVIRDSGGVAECLREFERLEEAGWKGKLGTAVGAQNKQGRFYRKVFENVCQWGEGVIWQFCLNGRTVASELCLERGGMLIALKTTYDETLKKFSPSYLMRCEIVKKLFEEDNTTVVEFYGRVCDWQRKWTDEQRTMSHINFFRNNWIHRIYSIIKKIRH